MTELTPKYQNLRFQRRAMLKALMAMPVAAGLAPLSLFAAQISQMPPNPSDVAESYAPEASDIYVPKILNPQEWKTIRALSDWILPADEISGSASDAGVPEFIDDWLDFQRGELLIEIRQGLAWLDTECNHRYQHPFVDCTTEQQQQMLDRIAYPQTSAPRDAIAVEFFNSMRDLVLSGFYTSEMGIRDLPYIGNEPQAEWLGCPAPVLEKLGI